MRWDEAVHEVRMCCKRIGALLRLIRPLFGGQYRFENDFFRDAAREPSGLGMPKCWSKRMTPQSAEPATGLPAGSSRLCAGNSFSVIERWLKIQRRKTNALQRSGIG